jgi:predicted kinase
MHGILSAPRPIVLIDGRSGAGKTTLAAWLAPQLGAELVRLDDLYPGWDGLRRGSDLVHEEIIPRSRWQAWDWARDVAGEWREFDASLPLVIEGAGALSRANRVLATYGIWVERDAASRKRRAFARDGDGYAQHWDRWAAQEEEFAATEHPRELADHELSGSSLSRPHTRETRR